MELLHWSELAGLVVVAQVVFPRCSTAVLQVAQGELAAGTLVERLLLRALTDLLSSADAAQAPARVSAPTSLGERSLCWKLRYHVSFRGPLVTPRGLQGHALSTVSPTHSGHSHFSRHCSSESV